MNIYVLMKRTFDTEEKITLGADGSINEQDAEFVINPYDEYAIEEAIAQRDKNGGEVTVVTVGREPSEQQLRTALAMGADRAVLIRCDERPLDPHQTAVLLANYLKDKQADLIIGGNIGVDWGTGQIGPRVAELLGIAQVTTITKLEGEGGRATVVRDAEGDEEIIEAQLPLLVTAQQGLNEPRYPSLPGIMKAKKKPLEVIDAEELGLAETQAKTVTAGYFLPPKKTGGVKLQGDVREQARQLVQKLIYEAKVI